MNKNNPLVSIIVRTKDRPHLLKQALKSIARQDYRPIEAVIVNDGGCDLPVNELRTILRDVSLSYMHIQENRGRAAAANEGVVRSSGRFIGFLDDDDEFYPDHVSTLALFLQQNEFLIAYTDSEIVRHRQDSGHAAPVEEERYVLYSEDFSYEKLILSNYIPLVCLMFDAQIRHLIRFDETFDLCEDWDLLIRLASMHTFYHISRTTARYNQNLAPQISSEGHLHHNAFIGIMEKHMDKVSAEALFVNWEIIVRERRLSSILAGITLKNNALHEVLEDKKKLLDEKIVAIEELRALISEKEKIIQQQSRTLQEKEELLTQRHRDLMEMQLLANGILNSIGWKIIEALRNQRDRIFPARSRRRYYCDLAVKSVRVINIHGFRVFWHKALSKIKKKSYVVSPPALLRNGHIQDTPYNRQADIVVPVCNAYSDLYECLKSVLNNTDLKSHRLILVDDKSTDPRVRNFMKTVADSGKGFDIVLLENEENLGFAGTVNRGMRYSERDVIILNSDTVVTKGWVDKLMRAAYSRDRVASVTPFSNNATICSIPSFCENNPLPAGFSIESFAHFIETISLRYYPSIPTGVGFCMYIKRNVLNDVGYFDEVNFRNGYGEENDFCLRAVKKGYLHVLDDATFIYHKGGASYTTEVKLTREIEAIHIMERLHPDYINAVQSFIHENPIGDIHNYISLRINMEKEAARSMPVSGYQ